MKRKKIIKWIIEWIIKWKIALIITIIVGFFVAWYQVRLEAKDRASIILQQMQKEDKEIIAKLETGSSTEDERYFNSCSVKIKCRSYELEGLVKIEDMIDYINDDLDEEYLMLNCNGMLKKVQLDDILSIRISKGGTIIGER